MNLQGVTDNTASVLNQIKSYNELGRYYLVGGTALAIRINSRLSEDIDLFFYNNYPGKKTPLPKLGEILKKINADFGSVKYLDGDNKYYARLVVDGVKLELHSDNRFHKPNSHVKLEQIKLPSEQDLIGMKITALHLRNAWRDVYDLYSLKQTHDLTSFYAGYNRIMSSNYCGSKKNKGKLFFATMAKLEYIDLLEKMYIDDNLEHLNPVYKLDPQKAVKEFVGFTDSMKNSQKP
jgi:hypothetical protein